MGAERLQKILAHAGLTSRRKAEALIESGHVTVNGKVIRELGSKADIDEDVIQVDGRTFRETQDKVYYVLYKPAGCVTTLSDPEDRPTIKTYLQHVPEQVYPVGRLDYDVEGAQIQSRTPKNTWVRVVVAEGRQHLVKRLMEAVGAPVQKLHRADYGGIGVAGMRPGEARELTRAEVQRLRAQSEKKAEAGVQRRQIPLPARRHGHGPPPAGG